MAQENVSEFILTDVSHLEGSSLHNGWIRIDLLPSLFCVDNPKLHSVDKLWQSIVQNGFLDPSKLDFNLTNVSGTKPALIFGHGRNQALFSGWQQWVKGTHEIVPEGIKYDSEYWYVPVTFGIDAKSEAQALDMLLFHNSSTLLGGDYTDGDIWRMYDKTLLAALGQTIQNDSVGDFEPLSMNGEELDDLLHFLSGEIPDRDDNETHEKNSNPKEITCPECGHKFTSN